MLNFLRKKSVVKTEEELIAEIHNEFDTAPQRLYDEAMRIINEVEPTLEIAKPKADRLKAIGFTGIESLKQLSVVEERSKDAYHNAKTVEYYSQNYPFLKFLNESELDRICDKYGLIYAPVANYIKDVPTKNLTEIENAQPLNNKDKGGDFYTYAFNFYGYVPDNVQKFFRELRTERRLISDSEFRDVCPIKYEGAYLYKSSGMAIHKHSRDGLFIAAPKSHFNLNGLVSDKKKGWFSTKTTIIQNDPIVFRYVKGGIQVLSKWGIEADDEALIVPLSN